jgi:O-antigen/teichoic acid export membrane protein
VNADAVSGPRLLDDSQYPVPFVAERMQRMVGMVRKLPLPEGTFAVGAGIAVAGLTAYAFQVLAYRQLTTRGSTIDYSAIFGLWVVVFILTPGFFQPLEQEVGRALAHRRAQGIGGAPLVKRAATLGGILALIAVAGSIVAVSPITSRVFNHDTVLFVSLLIGIVVYYASYIARGTLAGNGRFGPYGTMLGAEGVIRLVATVALVVAGSRTPGPYGLALVLPPVAAMLIALRGQKRLLEPGPTAPYSELSSAIGYLLFGSVLCQALSYSAYLVAISLETHAQATRVGKFAAGILIARIPILGFQAVQAALLPKLARLAGEGRDDEFRTALRQLVMIVVGVGVVGVLGSFTVGHAAGRLLFGTRFTLGNRDLGLLAVGSGGFIFALTLAQALIALRSYAAAALSWLAGAAGCVVGILSAHDLFLRSELSFGVGAVFAAVAMVVCLTLRLRSGVPMGTMERLVTGLEHEPLEL